jgi:peptide/nickel transport system substrate-binding protein
MIRTAIVAAGVGALIAGTAACASPAATPQDESISIRTWSIPGNWDPFQGAAVGSPAEQAVYEALLRTSADPSAENFVEPALAREWTVADDEHSVRFLLRDDVDFVDGEHMTAAGVADYLGALFASEGFCCGHEFIGVYGTEVAVVGEYELEFTTKVPIRATWYWGLASVPIISPAAAEDPSVLADGPVGTGPYVVKEIVPDVSASFTRNENYYDPESYPYDEVEVMIFDDDIAALNAVKTGQLDAGYLGDPTLAVEAQNAGLSTYFSLGTNTFLFFLDRDGSTVPAFSDVRVRQAIALAFDRESINDSINLGLTDAPKQMWPEGSPLHVEGGDDTYRYDPERARELLAEAGYPDGFDLTIPVMSGQTKYVPIVEQSLADIGIRVTIETIPDSDAVKHILEDWPNQKYAIAFWAMPPTIDRGTTVVRDIFKTGPNPKPAELIEKFTLGTAEESEAAIHDLGVYMLEDVWFVPIGTSPSVTISNPDVLVDIPKSRDIAVLRDFKPAP